MYLLHAVEYIPIWIYPDQSIVYGDLVEACPFLVGKEQVWHPDLFSDTHTGRDIRQVTVVDEG